MLQVIFAGILLFGVFLLFGKLWSGDAQGYIIAAKIFIPVWFVIAAANMWVGVTKAGYTIAQETPILLVIFAVPAAVAGLTIWQLARS